MKLDNIGVILVNPKYPENIGSVCRAMKTMGLRTLSIVNHPKPDWERIKVLAVHAYDIAEKAKHFATLNEATKEYSLIAGISRRRGKKRKCFALSPEELAQKINQNPAHRVALVFGNEESGLSESDLAACHLLVKIPTSPEFPSLNLSHAVQIITYIIFRDCAKTINRGFTPISDEHLAKVVAVINQSLENIGFFPVDSSTDPGLFFRDVLARAGMSVSEAKRLEIVFRKISGMVSNKGIDV